jgi:putative addiction module component (TIGR02574 family)
MSEKVAQVLQAALELSLEERADFLDAFQTAVAGKENVLPFDEEWLAEIQRRSEAYDRGEMQSYTWEEVKKRLQKRISGNE